MARKNKIEFPISITEIAELHGLHSHNVKYAIRSIGVTHCRMIASAKVYDRVAYKKIVVELDRIKKSA